MSDTGDSRRIVEPAFQFSLRHLLVLTAVIAVPIALISQLGAWGVLLCLILASVLVMSFGVYNGNGWFLAGMIAFVVLFSQVLMPIAVPHPHTSHRSTCKMQLRYIGLALQQYHDAHGCFPPAHIADANGRPMHSWRVLILPYLEQGSLYDQYRFDEPWDGPHNRLLADKMPDVYRCPDDSPSDVGSQMTSYLAVVGPEAAWKGAKRVSRADITDGPQNTLLVVESHQSGIHWMEPRDLHTTQMSVGINPPHGQGIGSGHYSKNPRDSSGSAMCLLADGQVQRLDGDLPPHTVRALLTISGGEDVELP